MPRDGSHSLMASRVAVTLLSSRPPPVPAFQHQGGPRGSHTGPRLGTPIVTACGEYVYFPTAWTNSRLLPASLSEPMSDRNGSGGGPRLDAELTQDMRDVGGGGAVADRQRDRDFLVGMPVGQQLQYLLLPRGQQ